MLTLLDQVYSDFPAVRRIGKGKGYEKILQQVKTNEDALKFQGAASKYISSQIELKTEPKYYKSFNGN